jgi:hypothetical protein
MVKLWSSTGAEHSSSSFATRLIRVLTGWQGLRMSACCRMLIFGVILNRLKQHFELL